MIEISNITKSFGSENVLRGISFQLHYHLTISVLGKSGCGKTTLLKILSGLETADTGTFISGGKDLLNIKPQKRGVVYLSQEPLLFPHMRIYENLAYGLKIRNLPKARIKEKVEAMAYEIGMSGQLDKMPHQLSGGQRQRVSFGRALIINPEILLLDEPFGSLDVHTRGEMQDFYQRIRKHFPITALFITHDLKEALIMGDHIAVMEKGEIRVFKEMNEFVQSPKSGAQAELDFWKNIIG